MEWITGLAASHHPCLRYLGQISCLQRGPRRRLVPVRFPHRRRLAGPGDSGDAGRSQDIRTSNDVGRLKVACVVEFGWLDLHYLGVACRLSFDTSAAGEAADGDRHVRSIYQGLDPTPLERITVELCDLPNRIPASAGPPGLKQGRVDSRALDSQRSWSMTPKYGRRRRARLAQEAWARREEQGLGPALGDRRRKRTHVAPTEIGRP